MIRNTPRIITHRVRLSLIEKAAYRQERKSRVNELMFHTKLTPKADNVIAPIQQSCRDRQRLCAAEIDIM